MTVALAGTGGDELLGGYTSFRELPRAQRWARRLRGVPDGVMRPVAGAAGRFKEGAVAGNVPPQGRYAKLPDFLSTRRRLGRPVPNGVRDVHPGVSSSNSRTHRLPRHIFESWGLTTAERERLRGVIAESDTMHAISLLELESFVGQRLLRDTDTTSMASSLEVRVPLLDHAFVEVLAGLEDEARFHPLGRKGLLREMALGDWTRRCSSGPNPGSSCRSSGGPGRT